jgi:uroporphyrin-3 C-methyltransferase
MSDPPLEGTQPAAAPDPATPGIALPQRGSSWRKAGPALWIAVFAAVLAAWQWYDSRSENGALRQELARRLADADAQSKESRVAAEQVREAISDVRVKIGVIENRLAESQSQQAALEGLFQELSRNRDEWAYAEIEQSLLIASQQLALGSNIKGALIALQSADARLQRLNRPQLAGLRKAINSDIERLKVAPHVDAVAISARLDGIASQVDKLPLAMDTRPPQEQPAAGQDGAEADWWTRWWRDTWGELKQLVRVQQIDRPAAPLLAPGQAYFLRENLRLRLISARLALLARDAKSYQTDLKAAREWLGRYYDTRNDNVAHTLAALQSLQQPDVGVEAPEITGTLEAMRNLRVSRERGR